MDLAVRLERLVRHPKRTLTALSLLLVAIAVAAGSGASFSSRTTNPTNAFSAGVVRMDNSKDNAAVLSADNMKPGAPPQTGTVDIQNTGSMDMRVSLSRDSLANTDTGTSNPRPFADLVGLTITDCGSACGDGDDRAVYGPGAPLSAMAGGVDLGTFAKDEKRRYLFSAALDGSAGNEYAGDGASARFVWDSVQTG